MEELLKYGDRRVKTSEKQAGKLRSFFAKVKDDAIRHFQNGVTFKQLINEKLYYKVLKNRIQELQESVDLFKEKFDKAENKNDLLNEYNELNTELEKIYKIITADITKTNVVYNLSNEKTKGLRDIYDEVDNQFEQFNDYFKQSHEINLSKDENSKSTNPIKIEPIKIDKSFFENKKSVEPQRFEPGELANVKNKKNDDKLAFDNKKKDDKLAFDNKKKDIKEKIDLSDLTIFKSYAEYKKAYFWNKYIDGYDSDVLENISLLLAKTADTTSKEFKGLLSEMEFVKARDKQVKDQEFFEIKASHKKEISSLNETMKKEIDNTKKAFSNKINSLDEELKISKSDIKKLKNIIGTLMDALDKTSKISNTIGGIPAIDEIITACKSMCDSFDKESVVKENSKEENDDLEKTAIAYAETVKTQNKNLNQENPKENDDLENAAVAYAAAINEKSAVKENSKEENDDLEKMAIAYAEAVKNQDKNLNRENSKENDNLKDAAVESFATAVKEIENNKLKEKKVETKIENSDKENENSIENVVEAPIKDSSEVSNISTQQVTPVSDDDVKESNELINELSTIDKGLDDYSKLINLINQSDVFSDENKEIMKNTIYSDFDQFVEQNPENNPVKVR